MISRRILLYYLIALIPALVYYNFWSIPLQDDAEIYWKLGKQWSVMGIYGTPDKPGGYLPPGYPAFISSMISMFGDDPRVVVTGNLVLYLLSIALAGRIGFLAYGENVSMAVMLLIGYIYEFFTLPSLLLTENVFIPLFLGGIVLMMESGRKYGLVRWGIAGFFFGAACLTRGILLALPPFLFVIVILWKWWPWKRRQTALAHIVALIAGLWIPVGAWTYRNYEVYGLFAPVSMNDGEVMALGNNKFNTYWFLDSSDPRRRSMGLYGTDKEKHIRGMNTAIEDITGNPVGAVVKGFIKVYWTFMGQSPWFANRAILEAPPVGLGVNLIYLQTMLTWQWLIFMMLTLSGAWHGLHTKSPRRLLILALCAYWVLFNGVAHINPRFRIPIIPLFAVYAAFYLVHVRKHFGKWRDRVMAGIDEPRQENKGLD